MSQNSGLMQGKRGVILGVANNRSIAWGIAKACHAAGAEIALTWQGDALKKRVEPLAKELDGILLGHCDVTDPATIDAVFDVLAEKWGKIDFVVHAIAFSDKDQLDGRYLETTADNFSKTMLISCYSLTAIAQRAEKLLTDGGSILTLTYYGAEKWMPHYNVMGVAKAALEASVRYLAADLGEKNIRVNAISAGPIKTLAASGIGDFRYILKWNEYNAPLRRTVTIEEVGDSALYLLSDMSRGVTGEVHHVDAGYHVVGMKRPDAPDISLAIRARNSSSVRCPRPSSTTFATARPHGMPPDASRARRTFRSTISAARQAVTCRRHSRRPDRARRPRGSRAAVRRQPARPRPARPWSWCARRLKLPPDDYAIDDRLREIGYGQWEGLTLPEMERHDAATFASRIADKWGVAAPSGESYASVSLRMRDWFDSLHGDTVTVAHGGTMRALMVALGIATPLEAVGHTDRAGRGLRVQRGPADEVWLSAICIPIRGRCPASGSGAPRQRSPRARGVRVMAARRCRADDGQAGFDPCNRARYDTAALT